jgi:WD40 repeat protein/tetratricopeptide (TPR) repeat protein
MGGAGDGRTSQGIACTIDEETEMSEPVNPYIAGIPLHEGQGFFGRQHVLREVTQELNNPSTNCLVLFGQRRIGKTSLLRHLEHTLPKDAFLAVYTNLQDRAKTPLGKVLYHLSAEAAEKADLETPPQDVFDDNGAFFRDQFLPQLSDALGGQRRPVFLLDEFDVLDQMDVEELPDTAAAKALFDFLREVMSDDPRSAFIFAVGRRTEDLSPNIMSTFRGSLTHEVWVLDEDSARDLVRQAAEGGDATLRYTDSAVERILALTSCHPYLTQLLCQRIWEKAYAGSPTDIPVIDESEVEGTVDEALSAGHNALVWLWDGLTPAERIYAAALAEISTEGQMISEEQVNEVLNAHAARFRRQEVRLAPADLVDRKVLEKSKKEGHEYRFAVEMIRRWVRSNWPLHKVKEELDQLKPMAVPLYESGKNSFRQRKFGEAVQYFEAALEHYEEHFGARLQLGEALVHLDELDRAVTELDRAYSLDEDSAKSSLINALLKRAEQKEEAGHRREARADCERVLRIAPDDQKAKRQRDSLLESHWENADISKGRHRLWVIAGIAAAAIVMVTAAITFYDLSVQPREASLQSTITAQAMDLATAEQQMERDRAAIASVTADARQIPPTLIPTPTDTATPPGPMELPARIGTLLPPLTTVILPENAYLLTQVACWGPGTMNRVTYSQDGSLLAVASSQGLYLYNTSNLREARFTETGVWAWDVAFSPDAESVALGLHDGSVMVWKARDGTLLHKLEGHTSLVNSIEFSPDGKILASAAGDGTVRLWDVDKGTPLRTLEGHTGGVLQVTFSPDGQMLASGAHDNLAIVWQVDDGQALRTLEGHTSSVVSVGFSPDGKNLATGSWDHTVRLWNTESWALLRMLEGHLAGVNDLAFSSDGALLASASDDDSAKLWRVDDGTMLHNLYLHSGDVHSVAFSPDDTVLVSGSDDNVIRFWRVADGVLLRRLDGYTSMVRYVTFSPDGVLLATASDDTMVRLQYARDGTLLHTLEGHTHNVQGVAFTPDGEHLASASDDYDVRLWSVHKGVPLLRFEGHTGDVNAVAISPDGKLVASGSEDNTIRLWNTDDGMLVRVLRGHEDWVQSLAFSPNGELLASGANDNTVRLWQPSDGTLLHTLEGHVSSVNSVAFSPDGVRLASASADDTIRLWQVDDGTSLGTLEGHTEDVNSVAFSPNGVLLASGSCDNSVRLWWARDGDFLRRLDGHTGDVRSVAFSPDGCVLASSSADGTVRLWGLIAEDSYSESQP